jgi:hypothetical protein
MSSRMELEFSSERNLSSGKYPTKLGSQFTLSDGFVASALPYIDPEHIN